jgi:polyhydroxyalkanoate synthesis regulator phasin
MKGQIKVAFDVKYIDRRDIKRCIGDEILNIDKIIDSFVDGGDVFIADKNTKQQFWNQTSIIEENYANIIGYFDDLIDLRDEMGEMISGLEYKISDKDDEIHKLERRVYELETKLREYE